MTTTPKPTEWHKSPRKRGRCPICQCPVEYSPGSHRATLPEEDYERGWLHRQKSDDGWLIQEVGRRIHAGCSVNKTTLGRYFHEHFLPTVLADVKFNTRHQYQNAVTQFCIFTGQDPALSTVTAPEVERFRSFLIDRKLSPSTIRQYICHIRRIVRHGRIDQCPPREGKRSRNHPRNQFTLTDESLDTPGSVLRFFREHYMPERMVGCVPDSVDQNVIAIRLFARHLGRPAMLSDFTDETMTRHLQAMLDEGLSRATVNSRRASLLAIWRWARRKRLVEHLPEVDKVKEIKRLPEAWTTEQVGQILDACRAARGSVGELPARDFWAALVLVLFHTGLRVRAAMLIEQQHVDLHTGWLFVPGDNQKQKVDQRFRLPYDAVSVIRRIWQPRRRLLFPFPSDHRQLGVRYTRILHRAGLPTTRKDKFHKLRRTTASYIAKVAGAEMAGRQLGHSGNDVTARYIDPRIAFSHMDATQYLPDLGGNGNGDNGA